MKNYSKIKKNIPPLLIAVVIFGFGIFVGFGLKQERLGVIGQDDNVIKQVFNLYGLGKNEDLDFNHFWRLWDKIKKEHINQPVNDKDLYYGALVGLVSGLNDPYSIYLPPREAEKFVKDLSGEFEGIGAEIGIRNDQLTIIAPLPGSPADKAGLKSGDKILAIDNEDSSVMTLDGAVSKIRGTKATNAR